MECVLYKIVMVKENIGIFLFVPEWVMTATLPALF
jgi:hypothetical protein